MRRILLGLVLLVAALVTVAIVAANDTAVAQGIANSVASGFGYRVAFEQSRIGVSHATLAGVRVTTVSGEPVLFVRQLDVGYSIPALVRGTRNYGLSSVRIVDPRITLIHHPSGTYNVKPISIAPSTKRKAPPWNVSVDVQNGSVDLIDEYSASPKVRTEQIAGIDVRGNISPQHGSYAAHMALHANGRSYPIEGSGRFDAPNGFESQHWTAEAIPIAGLVEFGLPTREVRVESGELRDVNLRMFSLADASGTLQPHLGGHADLAGVNVAAAALREPLRNAGTHIVIDDDAIAFPRMTATFAGIPVFASGGVYDFSAPTVRIGATLSAPLATLRTLSPSLATKPVAGSLAVRMLAIGPVQQPLVFAAFSSPRITYQRVAISAPHGLVALHGTDATIVDASLNYDGMTVGAKGTVTLQQQPSATLVARVSGFSDRIPYAAQIVPGMPLRGVAVLSGSGKKLALAGVLDGASRTQRLGAIANVAPNGIGTAGPITIDGPGSSSLVAMVTLDRPAGSSTVMVGAHHFIVRPSKAVALPGLSMRPLPNVSGTIDAHAVALAQGTKLAYLGGDAGVYAARFKEMSLDRMLAVGHVARNEISLVADLRSNAGALSRLGVPVSSGTIEAIARVDGTTASPNARLSALLAGGRVENADVFGHVELAYDGRRSRATLRSVLSLGGGLGTASGTVSGIRSGAPHYAIDAQMREADLALLTRTFGVHLPYAEGRIEANARVQGSGTSPTVAGTISIPEASINTLAFQAQTAFGGSPSHIVTHGGELIVGTSQLDFAADVSHANELLSLSSHRLDLADFNDYYPVAETLAGTGSIQATIDDSAHGLASHGTIAMSGVRYRRFALGNTYARWATAGGQVSASGVVQGQGGSLRLDGTARMGAGPTLGAIAGSTVVNATASVRNFELGTWLPAAGINAPILGRVDADATAHGRLRNVALATNATLNGGLIGRIPVQRLTISATANNGQARIASADFQIPYLTATGSGTFGFSPRAPVDLTLHATSPDIGALSKSVTQKPAPFGGIVDTTLRATGTRTALALDDVTDVRNFTHGQFTIPRAHAEVIARPGGLDVRDGTVAFARGAVTFSAHVPVSIAGLAFAGSAGADPPDPDPGRAGLPIDGRVTAQNVDLTQFATLMPSGTKLAGTLEGSIALTGTDLAPQFGGTLNLRNASYSSAQEATPLTHGRATLSFAGTRATLSNAHFTVGKKGSLDSRGSFAVANMRDPLHALAFNFISDFNDAVFNVPKYFSGQIDGTFAASKAPNGTPILASNLTISNTTIPAAGILAAALAKPSGKSPPPLGLDMRVALGNNVRVEGDGVNVGAAGKLAIAGTLASPMIDGSIDSTGGTIDLYRNFTIDRGVVTFTGAGLIPTIDATATTYLPQPPTNVRLHVTGPATHMDLALTSNPPYAKGQIIALMIGGPSLAGLNGLQTAQGSATPGFLQGVSQGFVNSLFAREITQPLTTNLGTALGLQNVEFNYDIAGAGGFSTLLSKKLGQNLSLLFSQTYGYPSRTTFGLRDDLDVNSAVSATLYSTYGGIGLGYYAPYLESQPGANISLQAEQPVAGQQGFGLHYSRYFGK